MKQYRIKEDMLELVGSKGTKLFKISEVSPKGIRVLDEADNGVEISRIVEWKDIK